MRILMLISVVLASGTLSVAQERKVPDTAARVTMTGCAKGRTFIVRWRSNHEPVTSDVAQGRRFRLSGAKQILADIKKQEGMMVEVTGQVRKSDLSGPSGVAIAGGRVRIGGGSPQSPVYADPARDPHYSQAVIDLESWQPLPESCPNR